MSRTFLVFSLVGMLWTLPAASQDPGQITIIVEKTGDAKALVLSDRGGTTTANLTLSDATGELSFPALTSAKLPTNLTIEWNDDESTTIPSFLFTPFAGQRLDVTVYRPAFAPEDEPEARELCFLTRPQDVAGAFRRMLGCQQWVELKQQAGEKWTKSYLRGLRGWFDGAYFLFTRVQPLDDLGLSPWGLQSDLVEELEAVTAAIDNGERPRSFFQPYLRIDDIEQALRELKAWELQLYAVVPKMIRDGNYDEASQLNQRVRAAFIKLSGETGEPAINGVSLAGLDGNEQNIATLVARATPH